MLKRFFNSANTPGYLFLLKSSAKYKKQSRRRRDKANSDKFFIVINKEKIRRQTMGMKKIIQIDRGDSSKDKSSVSFTKFKKKEKTRRQPRNNGRDGLRRS